MQLFSHLVMSKLIFKCKIWECRFKTMEDVYQKDNFQGFFIKNANVCHLYYKLERTQNDTCIQLYL